MDNEQNKPITVFISYSWDSEEHKAWVRMLADRLTEKGIEVLLDQYQEPGTSLTAFMQDGLRNADKVLVIGTPNYKRKAESHKGRTYTEDQIINIHMTRDFATTKFIPILRKGSYSTSFKDLVGDRSGFDFSDDKKFESEFEGLVDGLVGKRDSQKLQNLKYRRAQVESRNSKKNLIDTGKEYELTKDLNQIIDLINSSNSSDRVKFWLSNKIAELCETASSHLEHVKSTLPEFDLHNVSHSKTVLSNMVQLLGRSIKEMSSYELFFIALSAYLHDCGMALSDYEMRVLELTEGTDDIYVDEDSIKNDGKTVMELSAAVDFIYKHKTIIYKNYNKGDVHKLLFAPNDEEDWVIYLAKMLRNYQEHRNGCYKKILDSRNFNKTNIEIRNEFIRKTHHTRISQYVKNFSVSRFSSFPITGMENQIANDLADICQAHGENAKFIKNLSIKTSYESNIPVNIQFIAMLLRLGDIIHFSYDRAPIELRALRKFESSFSFLQWAIKSEGVNYSISEGLISFNASCSEPSYYYFLHQYLDWIDFELTFFHELQPDWSEPYQIELTKMIDRENIRYDKKRFIPAPGIKFRMNQQRILDLLMGVKLYKDEFACIRELYQNALDACRIQIAIDSYYKRTSRGTIEFGIGYENDERYLYCLDNGKGMSKQIIENYLLKIGESYYQSYDFYKLHSLTSMTFTPTSQFGIGILSCFMIGKRIEISSRESMIPGNEGKEESEYITCVFDSNELFYYKETSDYDRDKIKSNGTIVKVFLNDRQLDEYLDCINCIKPNYLGNYLVGQIETDSVLNDKDDVGKMETNLYYYLDRVLLVIPEDIEVNVKWEDDDGILKVLPKPYNFSENTLEIKKGDFWLDKNPDNVKLVKDYLIDCKDNGIEFRAILNLQKESIVLDYGGGLTNNVMNEIYVNDGLQRGYYSEKDEIKVCVNGISAFCVDLKRNNDYLYYLAKNGIVNFYGPNRPQLSIDRTQIVQTDFSEYGLIAERLYESIAKQVVEYTVQHLNNYQIKFNTFFYNQIWNHVIEQFFFIGLPLFNSINRYFYNLKAKKRTFTLESQSTNRPQNYLDILISKNLIIEKPSIDFVYPILRHFLYFRIMNASKIEFKDNVLKLVGNFNNELIFPNEYSDELTDYLCNFNNFHNTFDDYDIITNLLPLIPNYLFDLIESPTIITNNKKIPLKINRFNFQGFRLIKRKDDIYKVIPSDDFICALKYPSIKMPAEVHECLLALTLYITPEIIKEYKKKQEEISLKRLKEGLSVIFIEVFDGDRITETSYAIPGKASRKELVHLIPKSIWERHNGKYTHVFPNGTKVKDYLV